MMSRTPDSAPPQWKKPTSGGECLDYEVELITPMFGGGVTAREIDEKMPIRAREVRGQLRWWWRLLALARVNDGASSQAVHKRDTALWGSVDEEGATAGKIALRVRCPAANVRPYGTLELQVDKKNPKRSRYHHNPDQWLDHEGLNYVLFACKGESKGAQKIRDPDNYVVPPYKFELLVSVDSGEHLDEIREAMRWWAAFGGVGARTRRGAGAVRVQGKDGFLAPPDEFGSFGIRLEVGSKTTFACDSGLRVWQSCAQRLFDFRQGRELGRNRGGKLPGRSRWPEANAIRNLAGVARMKADGNSFWGDKNAPPRFPRAALGLPIQFQFKGERDDQKSDPELHRLMPARGNADGSTELLDRLASPVILKPLAFRDGLIAPAALRLPDKHVWAMNVELQARDEETWTRRWPSTNSNWWEQARDHYPNPKDKPNYEAANPLEAFLDVCAKAWRDEAGVKP